MPRIKKYNEYMYRKPYDNVEDMLKNKLLNMMPNDFTNFMSKIKKFGKYDYLYTFADDKIGKIVANWKAMVNIVVELPMGKDEFLYVWHDSLNGGTLHIQSLNKEDFDSVFGIDDIVKKYGDELGAFVENKFKD